MKKLAKCLLTTKVPDYYAKQIRALAKHNEDSGIEPGEAERRAAEQVLDDLHAERDDIHKQIIAAGGEIPTEKEPFKLETHTSEDVTAKEKAAKEAAAAEKAKADEEAKKAAADKSANDLRLTGSDRAADEATAHGQQSLFEPTEYNYDEREAANLQRGNKAAGTGADIQSPAPIQGQLDLFSAKGRDTAAAPPRSEGKFWRTVKAVRTGTFRSGIDRVTTPEQAAHVIAPLRREPQESMLALVTDKDGKPLAVLRHTIGVKDAASVDPAGLMGSIHAVPGAKKVWFAHNHPSGAVHQSRADISLTDRLTKALRGTGIDPKGMVVVTPDGKASFYDIENGGASREISIAPAVRTSEVPVTGRRFEKMVGERPEAVSSMEKAISLTRKMPEPSGVLLLDFQHKPVGWVPINVNEMSKLRTGDTASGAGVLLRAIDRSNASNMILKTGDAPADLKASANIGAFARDVGIRHFDTIANGRSLTASREGLPSQHEPFFSLEGVEDGKESQYRPSAAMRHTAAEPGSLEDLQNQMSEPEQLGRDVKLERVPATSRANRALANAIQRMFGREVVFFKGDVPEVRGVHIGGNKLYINADATKPHAQIIGHELLHSLRSEQPDTYNRLLQNIASSLNTEVGKRFEKMLFERRRELGMSDLSQDNLTEERLAETVGDHFADPAFIRELQKVLEPSVFRRVMAHVQDFLDRTVQRLGGATPDQLGRQASRFVQDIEGARAAVRQALEEIGPERGGGGEAVPAFSQSGSEAKIEGGASTDFSLDPDYASNITGIKHATVDKEREARGLPPLESAASKGFGQSWDEAKERIMEDPESVGRLVDEVRAKPRPLNDVENAMLLHRRVTLHNAYQKAMALVNDAGSDEATVGEYATRTAAIEDDMDALDKVLRSVGAEQGRGLAARKMMADESYELASMAQQYRTAAHGAPLTDADRKVVEKSNKRINDAKKAVDKKEVKADEKASQDQGKEVVDALKTKVKGEDAADTKAGRKRAPKKDAGEIVKSMKKDFDGGKPLEDMGSYIQRLCESFIRQGVDKLDPLVDAVHQVLKQHVAPDITRRQTMDAISGYGDFKKLNPDAVKATLRDLRGQAQQVAKLQDIEAGKAPLKTGMERRTPSDEERRLIQQVNEAKRRAGFLDGKTEDTLKGALASIKTRLRNQISDLDYQIATGKKFVDEKTKVKYDAEAEELKKHRDDLKQQFDDIFGKPEMTDEQRIEAAKKAVQKSIDRYEQRIKEKDFQPEPGKPPVSSKELDALKARRDALKQEFETLKNADPLVRQKNLEDAMAQVRGRIDELNRKISLGDISKPGAPEKLSSPELEALRAERDKLNGTLNDMRQKAMSPEEKNRIALQAWKTRVHGIIADTLERTARGDFSAKERRPLVMDEEGNKLQAELNAAKKEWQKAKLTKRLENRRGYEKWADFYTRWSRAFLLSSPAVFGKLTAAAAARLVTRPIEELAGQGFHYLLPELSKRAPIQGGGLNAKAEAKALREGLVNYHKHFGNYLAKRGDTEKELLYGHGSDKNLKESDVQPDSLADWVGLSHGAFKNAVKEAEFARAFEKQASNYIAQGIDVQDPMVKFQMGVNAWKEANRSIFLGDNRVVDFFNETIGRMERKDKEGHASVGGKIAATAMRTVFPIVRVPTNIVAETMQYAAGLATGSAKYALAIRKGIESLEPEQADQIMRELKKGAIGGPLLLLGYFAPQMFGGYYQKNEKRSAEDVRPGFVRINGVDVPKSVTEAPAFQAAQLGSTVRRVADMAINKRNPDEHEGLWEGMLHGAFGLVSEVPFLRETADWEKIGQSKTMSEGLATYLGELAKSKVVPGVAQWVAREMDMDKPILSLTGQLSGKPYSRETKGFVPAIQEGIPGLRSQLPMTINQLIDIGRTGEAIEQMAKSGMPPREIRARVRARLRDNAAPPALASPKAAPAEPAVATQEDQ
jgi:hypothetical protein